MLSSLCFIYTTFEEIGGAIIFFGRGIPNILGCHKFLERKIGGGKIFDDQNVGSHKMTTDSVFILFKKTDFSIQFQPV